ncbi:Zinc finger protein [Pseudolycoriella hygida]|uniref:Zinc finger protein n=1 Tax=Pseudolycoriella hygida TaxID=35572 RepID=A0A9Q0NAI3_9DIPT|nr:Zinc finger protein [Pseudolycoriella hygida]
MSETLTLDGLEKSAIIYRDKSASFIYVCYHCGRMFNEINETLQHIESHFELANVVVEQFNEGGKEEDSINHFAVPETVNVKVEIFDNHDVEDSLVSTKPVTRIGKDNRQFCCKLCDSIQQTKFLNRVHVLNEHLSEPLKCRHCSSFFDNGVDFESHLRLHMEQLEVHWRSTIEGIHTSTQIDWSLYESKDLGNKNVPKKKAKLDSAVRPKQRVRAFQCHKCSQTCRNVSDLRSHLKTHSSEELLQINRCKECDSYHKNAFALRVHVLQTHLKVDEVSCNSCAEQFLLSQAKQFEEHLNKHNGLKKKLWTDISNGICHQHNDLTEYEETTAFTEEQFPCEFCAQRFYIKSNLEAHTRSVHSSQRRLQCSQCPAIFTTPMYYIAHQLEHKRVGPIITERDDNVLLANLDALVDEQVIYHEQEYDQRTFSCALCNLTFDYHSEVRGHIRQKHIYSMFPLPLEPKKECICDMCGMTLKSKSALKNHLRIHTNIKPHACSICGKTFRLNSDRKIHERQHTGEVGQFLIIF